MDDLVVIEGRNSVHLASRAMLLPDDYHTDWQGAANYIKARGDMAYCLGHYVMGDKANTNGNIFPTEDLVEAHKLVPTTPFNMLHRKNEVIGTFLASELIYPEKKRVKDASDLEQPVVDSLSNIWRHHFPDQYRMIQEADANGSFYLSMEALAQSLTCMATNCCDNKNYPYRGTSDDTYCDSLKQPRALKILHKPHFVGGAAVIPPYKPGWRTASAGITAAMAATIRRHPDEAERVYSAIAQSADHLDPVEWEVLMAMLLAGAFDDGDERITIESFDVERLLRRVVTDGYGEPDDDGPSGMTLQVTQDEASYRPSVDPEVKCGSCSHFMADTNTCEFVSGTIDASMVCDLFDPTDEPVDTPATDVKMTRAAKQALADQEAAAGQLVAAGLCVLAADTGRVLLLQRSLNDPTDPAAGTWEFPGGKLEEGEAPLDAAKREWSEETGCPVPDGEIVGSWTSPNGVYQGFVLVAPEEDEVEINCDPENRSVLNPDDPDGDEIETCAWWQPEHLPGMPALRPEMQSTDWSVIGRAVKHNTPSMVPDVITPDEILPAKDLVNQIKDGTTATAPGNQPVVVNVTLPSINLTTPAVTVNHPDINVDVHQPDVNVDVHPPDVNVDVHPQPPRTRVVERDEHGLVTKFTDQVDVDGSSVEGEAAMPVPP